MTNRPYAVSRVLGGALAALVLAVGSVSAGPAAGASAAGGPAAGGSPSGGPASAGQVSAGSATGRAAAGSSIGGSAGERGLGAGGWGVDQAAAVLDQQPTITPLRAPSAPGSGAPGPGALAAGASWTVSGAGAGHGVGMSQYGALAQAEAGWRAAQTMNFYYPGTTLGPAVDAMTLVVNLQDHVPLSTVTTSAMTEGGGGFVVMADGVAMSGGASTSVTFSASGSQVTASCAACSGATLMRGSTVTMRFADGKTLANVGVGRYDVGVLTVLPSDKGGTIQVGLRVRVHDEYLDRIAEMPWSWPAAALQAQAMAARAYALSRVKDGLRPECACHVYSTRQDQVFTGYPSNALAVWGAWKAAVRAGGSATTGQVPKYAGSVIRAYYSPANGGWTQSSADAWGMAQPYLVSVPDPWSLKEGNPYLSWTRTVSGAALAQVIGVSDVARLDLSRRTRGHALGSVRAYSHSGGVGVVAGSTFAERLGLPSPWVRHRAERIIGDDQTELAALVARGVSDTAGTVVLTSSDPAKLPDTVSAPPLAKTLGAPVLLVDQYALPMPTVDELNRRVNSLKNAVIVGGPSSVDQRVLDQLAARGLNVTRIDGADRYEVAKNVAIRISQVKPVTNAIVVGGTALPDAVGVGGPAVGTRTPVLFTPSSDLGPAAAAALDLIKPKTTQVVGGPASVSGTVVAKLEARGISTIRLSGANRYEVSVAVAAFFAPKLPGTKLVLAAGEDSLLMDPLLGAPLGRPIVLVKRDHLPSAVAGYLQTLNWLSSITVIGGPSHIDDPTLQAVIES